jgi:predicted transposase/invertase (TIGR01784 family)
MRKKTTPAPKGKFAQLTLDFPFKKTFASEGDEDILIALLNAFLEKKLAHPITQVVILNPYIQGQTKANRDAHLDIRCQDSEGNRFIVEMQTGRQKHFFKRAVYYSSMAISGGGKKGKGWNFNFPNVYSLNFLDYDIDFGKGNNNIVQYFSFSDDEYPEIKQNCMNLVFVKLAKFKKSMKECESLQDKLIFSLCHAHEMDCKPEQFAGKLFDRLFEIARISNFTSEEVSEYEASLMTRWDYSASMEFAKEEGFALGEARGIALGRDEGIALGEARGVAIGETKGVLQTARKMKAKGFNIAVICEITGLSEAEIKGLD